MFHNLCGTGLGKCGGGGGGGGSGDTGGEGLESYLRGLRYPKALIAKAVAQSAGSWGAG